MKGNPDQLYSSNNLIKGCKQFWETSWGWILIRLYHIDLWEGLPRWLSGEELACQCRRCWFDPWLGRSPGGRNVNPAQYSCLENSMDRGAWWATVHRVTKSQTQLKWLSTQKHVVKHKRDNIFIWWKQAETASWPFLFLNFIKAGIWECTVKIQSNEESHWRIKKANEI